MFPSSGGSRDSLARAYLNAINKAATVKSVAQLIKDESLAGPIQSKKIVDFATFLVDAQDLFNQVAQIPGIGQYAKDQIQDQTLNLGVEFNAMVSEITATKDWIVTNFPKDVNGYLQMVQFDVNGRFTIRTLTTAQTSGLRAQIDNLINTID